jgi:hypothetical protein
VVALGAIAWRTTIRTASTLAMIEPMTRGANRTSGDSPGLAPATGWKPIEARASICEPTRPAASAAAARPGRRQNFKLANAAAADPLATATPSENGASSKPTSAPPLSDASSAPWLAATPRPRIAPGAITASGPRQRANAPSAQIDDPSDSASDVVTPSSDTPGWTGKLRPIKGCDHAARPSAAPIIAERDHDRRGARFVWTISAKTIRHATKETPNEIAAGACPTIDA